MNTTHILIGTVSIDTLHLVFLAISLGLMGLAVWLFPFRNQLSETQDKANSLLDDHRALKDTHANLEKDYAVLAARVEEIQTASDEHKADLTKRLAQSDEAKRTIQLRLEEAEKHLEAAKVRDDERRQSFEAERKQLLELREEVETKFSEIAQSALGKSQKMFLETANETFSKQKEAAAGNLKSLVSPLKEAIGKFETRVETMEKVRAEDKSAIFEQVKQIGNLLNENRSVTSKLVTALSSPKGGGRWGEESLRNVLEMAGLSEHADFSEQVQGNGDTLRPDVIIRMPGGREIVVDAKVTIDDFLRAAEEADPEKRDYFLANHARKLKDHVKRLASKEYWKAFESRVDFVAMYVPGENFYAAALQVERDLFDYAARNRVLIVTPSTLIALAKAVSYGWRQEEATRNAREAAELGRELYKRLATMSEHVERMGKSLKSTVKSYDSMTSSLESRVLTQARRFEDLQIAEAGGKEIPKLELIDGHIPDDEDTDLSTEKTPRLAKS